MKNEDRSVEIYTKNLEKTKKENALYNYEVAPEEFDNKDPNYRHVISKIIPIGTADPVLKFKQWETEFWKKKKPSKDENK